MHLDLHIHSTCSDGTQAPEDVVRAAARAGLHAIAITDHDTAAGVAPARAEASRAGVLVIAGCELTCAFESRELHVLGYGIDPAHEALASYTGRMIELRRLRIGTIVRKLNEQGVPLEESDVILPPGNTAAGRPHVAAAMVRRGFSRTIQDAFLRHLGDRAPAYDVTEAIAAIRAAGGISVWAHPSIEDARNFERLAALGLGGVEALRPSVQPTVSSALEHSARDAGLVVSGGSDWHGGLPGLGAWYVTDRHVAGLLEKLGIDRDGKGTR
jgi:predicted metal-dependent phosphoesterase TrpH